MSCRDYNRCTEVALISLLLFPLRLAWGLLTFWNIGLVQKKCPQCGHRLKDHKMVGGKFVD
jgi:hypothetical protein